MEPCLDDGTVLNAGDEDWEEGTWGAFELSSFSYSPLVSFGS